MANYIINMINRMTDIHNLCTMIHSNICNDINILKYSNNIPIISIKKV